VKRTVNVAEKNRWKTGKEAEVKKKLFSGLSFSLLFREQSSTEFTKDGKWEMSGNERA
jgi:hypothetical protein